MLQAASLCKCVATSQEQAELLRLLRANLSVATPWPLCENTLVKTYLPLAIVLLLTSAYGFWWKRRQGAIRSNKAVPGHRMTEATLGEALGSRATMVQFSSAFCAPCRATHSLLSQMVIAMNDVKHIHIDAESHLELVRELDIRSTPTTLFINAQGIEVGRAAGTPKREQVLAALANIR
ncbi:MAG: thioredoxin [Actinobacteria bacterium]|nr:thioredoxin [Actinomycetota bacterium]